MQRLTLSFFFLVMTIGSAQAASPKTIAISIDSPHGGEVYSPGQQQSVVLGLRTIAKSALVEISRDGGATFVKVGTIDNAKRHPGLPPSLQWSVTDPLTNNAVIRVTSMDPRHPGSGTSNGFSVGVITGQPTSSGTASSGFVLTADGLGGAGFLPPVAANTVTGAAGNSVVTALNSVATTLKLAATVLADFPKAHVSNSTLITLPNGIDTALGFDTVEFDSDNFHDFVATPTRLTCKTAGVYFVSGYAAFALNSTGFRHGYLLLNGGTPSANAVASDVRPAFNTSDFTVTTLVALKVGDFIEFVVAQNSGAALSVNARGFMIARLP